MDLLVIPLWLFLLLVVSSVVSQNPELYSIIDRTARRAIIVALKIDTYLPRYEMNSIHLKPNRLRPGCPGDEALSPPVPLVTATAHVG